MSAAVDLDRLNEIRSRLAGQLGGPVKFAIAAPLADAPVAGMLVLIVEHAARGVRANCAIALLNEQSPGRTAEELAQRWKRQHASASR